MDHLHRCQEEVLESIPYSCRTVGGVRDVVVNLFGKNLSCSRITLQCGGVRVYSRIPESIQTRPHFNEELATEEEQKIWCEPTVCPKEKQLYVNRQAYFFIQTNFRYQCLEGASAPTLPAISADTSTQMGSTESKSATRWRAIPGKQTPDGGVRNPFLVARFFGVGAFLCSGHSLHIITSQISWLRPHNSE
jgi:hypothetical protein